MGLRPGIVCDRSDHADSPNWKREFIRLRRLKRIY